ncbi:hypothetical protein P8452_30608 [Trifolium repens]|nr:hypothetical protein P8452_30608 [Trifolium repens]
MYKKEKQEFFDKRNCQSQLSSQVIQKMAFSGLGLHDPIPVMPSDYGGSTTVTWQGFLTLESPSVVNSSWREKKEEKGKKRGERRC